METPTPYPEVNALLQVLLENVQSILGHGFVGMYLDGSLANGGFDEDSDIDFVAVTQDELSSDIVASLYAMHEHIAAMDSPFAVQLEGSYLSMRALRRYDPAYTLYPNIERGNGERLKLVNHEEPWNVHRSILRERGIVLAGPPPQTLIDPVFPDDLRRAMRSLMAGWVTQILAEPAWLKFRGYQSYIVLSLCRVLYTLQFGAVASKQVAAQWAQATLGQRWVPLIERAWEGRHNPGLEPSSDDVTDTLAFARYALDHGHV